jgi:hypothetical protein
LRPAHSCSAEAPAPQKAPEPISPSGFRDISMPEIIPAQAEKSNMMFIILGVVALVIAVLAWFAPRPVVVRPYETTGEAAFASPVCVHRLCVRSSVF